MNLDLAKLALELVDVVLQRVHEQLGMLCRHDETSVNFCLGNTGQHSREVNNKLRRRVRDDCKVRVNPFRFFFTQLDIDLLAGLLLIVHSVTFM